MRPIDADALIEKCGVWYVEEGTESGFIGTLKDLLATEPTIQPEKAQLSQQGTTKDAISKQAAIDAAKDWYEGLICGSINGLIKRLNALPTVHPEPKEGHWIPHETPDGGERYECSRCGVLWEFTDGTPEDNEAYFCPKCGKKLITK